MTLRILITIAALGALTACSSTAGKQRERANIATRTLDRLPPQADPGLVVAAEIAFARAALDEGQWTAASTFAADNAQVESVAGPSSAQAWLVGRANPPQPVRWAPRAVWSSCDGTLAVSESRYRQPDGQVGTYLTVWEAQRSREQRYKWSYRTGTPDDPQPQPPAKQDTPTGEDIILVEALSSITALTADCLRGEPLPDRAAQLGSPPVPAPAFLADAVSGDGIKTSADGTLQWRRESNPDGSHMVSVDWLRGGAWEQATHLDVPAKAAR